jgi:hypothetical protein|tara:strand:- start:381 stop:572 length:192 start_codon:yes stop_codon:yes gene_type:complete
VDEAAPDEGKEWLSQLAPTFDVHVEVVDRLARLRIGVDDHTKSRVCDASVSGGIPSELEHFSQ